MSRARDAAAGKEILDLSDGMDRQARVRETVEQRRCERREREVAAIRRAPERPLDADEGARDDAADTHPDTCKLEGDFAPAIQLGNRHDVFVRRDLEDTVGRRVHDWLAGAHVFGAQLLDDGRAARRLVGQRATAYAPLELADAL